MDNLKFENYGLKQLSHRELQETEGGFLFTYAAILTIAYFAGAGAHLAYDAATDHQH